MAAPPTVKDRPLVDALRFVREQNRPLLGMSMVLFAMDALTCFVSRMAGSTLALLVVFAMLRAVVRGFLRLGLLRSLDSARRGEPVSVDEMTSGFDCFESAIGAHVVTDLVVLASLVVGGLPGLGLVVASVEMVRPALFVPGLILAVVGSLGLYFYAYAGVRFAEHVVALERLSTMAAVSRAWKLARGKRLRILRIVFIASTLEMGGLLWGLAAFGVGMLFSVPYFRLAGDHALLGLFTKLQAEDRAAAWRADSGPVFIPAPAPGRGAPHLARMGAVRGTSLPEYALILVAVLLVAAGAFRALGTSVSASADKAAAVLKSGLADVGGGAAAAGPRSPLGGFLSDFADGFFKGDFSDRQGFGKVAGQIVGSFIPVYGQIAAVRDVGAALRDVAEGKKGAYANLGLASVGLLPGLGGAAKAGLKTVSEAAKVAKAAEEVAEVAKVAKAAEETAQAAKAAESVASAAKAEEAAAVAAAKAARDAELQAIYSKAGQSKSEIDALADKVAAEHGGTVAKAPLKSPQRIVEKAEADYGGDLSRVKDVARNTIVVKSGDEASALKSLREANPNIADKDVKVIKAETDPLGYSGTNVTVPTKNGGLAEVQINSPEMIFAKEKPADARRILGDTKYDQIASRPGMPEGGKGHSFYEQYRSSSDPAVKEQVAAESRQYYNSVRNAGAPHKGKP